LPGEFATSAHFSIATTLAIPGGAEWFLAHGQRIYPDRFVSHVRRIQAELGDSHAHLKVTFSATGEAE
jgi:hypothetical protein